MLIRQKFRQDNHVALHALEDHFINNDKLEKGIEKLEHTAKELANLDDGSTMIELAEEIRRNSIRSLIMLRINVIVEVFKLKVDDLTLQHNQSFFLTFKASNYLQQLATICERTLNTELKLITDSESLTYCIYQLHLTCMYYSLWLEELNHFKNGIMNEFNTLNIQYPQYSLDTEIRAATNTMNESLHQLDTLLTKAKQCLITCLEHVDPESYKRGLYHLLQKTNSEEQLAVFMDFMGKTFTQDEKNQAFLHAAQFGNVGNMQIMVEFGANPASVSTFTQRNALHKAVAGGHVKCCEYLIALDTHRDNLVNSVDKLGKTPRYYLKDIEDNNVKASIERFLGNTRTQTSNVQADLHAHTSTFS